MIAKEDTLPRAGSLILVSGRVTIVDLQAVRPLFDMYTDLIAIGKAPLPDWGAAKPSDRKKMLSMLIKYLDSAPLGVQLVFETPTASLWGTINPKNLRESVGDLNIKHGPTLSETWHMLAIVDVVGSATKPRTAGLPDFLGGLLQASSELLKLLGKPATAVGVTPLLLFRKLDA